MLLWNTTYLMLNKKIKYIFAAGLTLLIGYILYDSFSQPTTSDLKGNFKETAVYRNENNTGPIMRIYAVTVQGNPWEEMQQYGDMMPYTKYGSTKVYFFPENQPAPQSLVPDEPNFDAKFNGNCLAVYEKDGSGQVKFVKAPFSSGL
jgi:hypothetical protein